MSFPFLKPSVASHPTRNKMQTPACKRGPCSLSAPWPSSPSSACVPLSAFSTVQPAGGLGGAQAAWVFCSFRTLAPCPHEVGPPHSQANHFFREAFVSALAPGIHCPVPCSLTSLHFRRGNCFIGVLVCFLLSSLEDELGIGIISVCIPLFTHPLAQWTLRKCLREWMSELSSGFKVYFS